MLDDARPPAEGFGGFTPWPVFVDKHFPMPVGRRRSDRSRRDLARRYGFQLIRIGHHFFVDEKLEAERLREALLARGREPRKPGRPRNTLASRGVAPAQQATE